MYRNDLGDDLVTVIVPVYNVKKYISRCLDTVLGQTYKNIEVIVVNDGSTDGSDEICMAYAQMDKRIRFISQDNKGLACARNAALKIMKGSFLMCVDSDDFIATDMVEKMVYIAKETGADYVSCGYRMLKDEDAKKFLLKSIDADLTYRNVAKEDSLSKLFMPQSRYCSAWAKLYRRDLWDDNLFYPNNNRFGEDMYVAHILIDRAGKIVHIDEEYYFYNQSGSSLVRSEFNDEKLNILEVSKIWIKFCNDRYPMLKKRAEGFYYMNYINFFTSFLIGGRDDLYRFHKKILQKDIPKILHNNYVQASDKMKACLIAYLTKEMYEKIRNGMSRKK